MEELLQASAPKDAHTDNADSDWLYILRSQVYIVSSSLPVLLPESHLLILDTNWTCPSY